VLGLVLCVELLLPRPVDIVELREEPTLLTVICGTLYPALEFSSLCVNFCRCLGCGLELLVELCLDSGDPFTCLDSLLLDLLSEIQDLELLVKIVRWCSLLFWSNYRFYFHLQFILKCREASSLIFDRVQRGTDGRELLSQCLSPFLHVFYHVYLPLLGLLLNFLDAGSPALLQPLFQLRALSEAVLLERLFKSSHLPLVLGQLLAEGKLSLEPGVFLVEILELLLQLRCPPLLLARNFLLDLCQRLLSLFLELHLHFAKLLLLLGLDNLQLAAELLLVDPLLLCQLLGPLVQADSPLLAPFHGLVQQVTLAGFLALEEGVDTAQFALELAEQGLPVFAAHSLAEFVLELAESHLLQAFTLCELGGQGSLPLKPSLLSPLLCELFLNSRTLRNACTGLLEPIRLTISCFGLVLRRPFRLQGLLLETQVGPETGLVLTHEVLQVAQGLDALIEELLLALPALPLARVSFILRFLGCLELAAQDVVLTAEVAQ
jgi:hypothetical protein